MFRISDVHIRNFGSEEYPEFECGLQGGSLFIHGTNNTGKSTTLDGLIYSIFGYRFIERAATPTDESEITLSNGDLRCKVERKYNKTDQLIVQENGSEPQEISGHEDIFDKLVEILYLPSDPNTAKLLITSLILPQRTEDAPLRNFSKDELKKVILTFASGKETSERIEELEGQIEEHDTKIEELRYKKSNLEEEIDDDKIVIQRNKNYFKDLEEFLSVYKSGEIFELRQLFEKESEIQRELDTLYSERTSTYDELIKTRRKIGDLLRYHDKGVLDSAKETLSVLTCPVCSSGVDIQKVESRKKTAHCPFCGVEEYSGELYEALRSNIELAEDQIEDLRQTANTLERKKDEVEHQIQDIKSKHQRLNSVNRIVVKELRGNPSDEELSKSFREYEDEYRQVKQTIAEKEEGIETNEKLAGEVATRITQHTLQITDLDEERERIEEEITSEHINRFNKELDSIYKQLITPLDHTLFYKEGKICLDTGFDVKDCADKHTLGYSQRRIVDVALWLTFHRLNHSDRITALNYGLFDDIFENIDNNQVAWKDNMISSLRSFQESTQLITCSIDGDLNNGLNCEKVRQLQYQSDLEDFNQEI